MYPHAVLNGVMVFIKEPTLHNILPASFTVLRSRETVYRNAFPSLESQVDLGNRPFVRLAETVAFYFCYSTNRETRDRSTELAVQY